MAGRLSAPPPLYDSTNLMLVTDPHLEIPAHPNQWRSQKTRDDLNRMTGRSRIDGWLFGGDYVGSASASETAPAQAWVNSINTGGKPRAFVPGNHDLVGMQSVPTAPYLITPAQWASQWSSLGVTGRDYVVDVGADLRVVCMSPIDVFPGTGPNWRLMIGPDTIAWADARLSETTRRCVMLFHAPPRDTVGYPDDGVHPSSSVSGWYADDLPGSRIADLLAAHPNVIAWASGHTHTPPHVAGIVARKTYGATTLAAVSGGGTFLISNQATPTSTSACLSIFDDRIEVRYRDHGRSRWLRPVHTVALD